MTAVYTHNFCVIVQVDRFASSNDLFYNVFSSAMIKVIENTKGVELYNVGGKTHRQQSAD